jgi:hypothetical protein
MIPGGYLTGITRKKKLMKKYSKKPFGTLHKVMPSGVGCSQNKHPSEAEPKGAPSGALILGRRGAPCLGVLPYTEIISRVL